MVEEICQKTQNNAGVWTKKPVLNAIYYDFYQRILSQLSPGKTLEIGGGIGNLKSYFKDVITSDIIPSPWLDCVFDAQSIPFQDSSITNIVMVDVLHHIEYSSLFFKEAERVLKEGGRLVILDPAITPLSYPFYHWFHEEMVDLKEDALREGIPNKNKRPYDSNQAIPTLIFRKNQARFKRLFPSLKINQVNYLSLWAYPLSGGFQDWCLLPELLVKPMLKLEAFLERFIGRFCAFRMLIVVEKTEV